jgi:hypothetical protein
MSDEKVLSSSEKFYEYIDHFLSTMNKSLVPHELELGFGGEGRDKYISKTTFNNVIKKLKSVGFKCEVEEGSYYLNINQKVTDIKSGKMYTSNLRTTINGVNNISHYCKNDGYWPYKNSTPSYVSFMEKKRVTLFNPLEQDETKQKRTLGPIFFNNYHCKVNYKTEKKLETDSNWVNNETRSWQENKKVFRFIKRYTLTHPLIEEFKIDCSIVKEPRTRRIGKKVISLPFYNVKESNVFNEMEHYEIELELNNAEIKRKYGEFGFKAPTWGTHKWDVEEDSNKNIVNMLYGIIKKGIKYIISGIQHTNYPISYIEKDTILKKYITLTYEEYIDGKKKKKLTKQELLKPSNIYKRQSKKYFAGPYSVTLERKHIRKNIEEGVPNINNNYAITEKADGLRQLLYISDNGKIYFIDINLKVTFSGCVTKNKKLYETLIDGEYVSHNKAGEYINTYLMFDLYYSSGEDYRKLHFYNNNNSPKGSRLNTLTQTYNILINGIEDKQPQMKNIIPGKPLPMKFKLKKFKTNITQKNIYSQLDILLEEINGGTFEYEVDGIIFTPNDEEVPRGSWLSCFKWKPPHHNSIDFLVETKKNENDDDFMGTIFSQGSNLTKTNDIQFYKTLTLRVGFSQRRHGIINPVDMMINDEVPKRQSFNYKDYYPAAFYPSPNYKQDWHLCNVLLKSIGSKKEMIAEDGNSFEDQTIVEFKFDKDSSKDNKWKWIPIKVRYDKTYAYRKGESNYGNDYKTANGVWKSIHFPVTEDMLIGKTEPPPYEDENDIYYSERNGKTNTQPLRNFHNRYVKHNLIKNVSEPGHNLLDLAVGKAGDLSKWIDARLNTVIGIDYSKDNIQNQVDGAITRFLKEKQYGRKIIPKCMFLHGDSSKNVKDGSAFFNDKYKNIMNSIYGLGSKDRKEIGEGVHYFRENEIGKNINIVSIQFALHYFFRNKESLHELLKNVSQNCSLNGYFIGTCYNGLNIWNLLLNREKNESYSVMDDDDNLIWSIKKLYNSESFNNDDSSLGLPVEIFQESINKRHTEFIVNFKYFEKELENYGFIKCPAKDLKKKHYNKAVGSFEELFNKMVSDVDKNDPNGPKASWYGQALKMSKGEKKVSFLNNYFIYKKVRNVDIFVNEATNEVEIKDIIPDEIVKQHEEIDKKMNKKPVKKVTKLKKKIKLVKK